VFLFHWCIQCSLNHPTGKSLVVLSQEIGVDTPHSLPCPNSRSANRDEHWFYRHHQSHYNTAIQFRLLGDCVKTCSTVSTHPLSVELQGLQSVSFPYFALFHQPRTYADVQLLHMVVVVFQFISPTSLNLIYFRPLKEYLRIHLYCSRLSFCLMLASAI
jgi:hypothetical protein